MIRYLTSGTLSSTHNGSVNVIYFTFIDVVGTATASRGACRTRLCATGPCDRCAAVTLREVRRPEAREPNVGERREVASRIESNRPFAGIQWLGLRLNEGIR